VKSSSYYFGIPAVALLLQPACKPVKENPLPNIVFILADDLGYGDLSCLNPGSRITTPEMDRIAREGMTFSRAHSPSAVSSPTRYGILTGEYCFRTSLKTGVLTGLSPALVDPRKITSAEVLRTAGYESACIGKWHLGLDWSRNDTTLPLATGDPWAPVTSNVDWDGSITGGPNDHGFDYSFIIPASLDIVPYCYIRNGKLIAPVKDTIAGCSSPRGAFWRSGDIQEGFELDQVLQTITGEAVKFISDRAGKRNPFFLYLPLSAPHEPWLPASTFKNKSAAGTYGDFVTQVDSCVGEINRTLERMHLSENTIVIVTSDNGADWTAEDIAKWSHRSNWIFRGQKSDIWEGGHHIPFLVKWPARIKGGSKSDQLVCLTDLSATCSELTRYSRTPADGPDSFSFLPALLGTKPVSPLRTSIIHHSVNGMFAITSGDWKFIDGKGSGGWSGKGKPDDPPGQLYNLAADPGEAVNLYTDNPSKVAELKRILDEIKK
jgi:arylsulfatase A-like enzyme